MPQLVSTSSKASNWNKTGEHRIQLLMNSGFRSNFPVPEIAAQIILLLRPRGTSQRQLFWGRSNDAQLQQFSPLRQQRQFCLLCNDVTIIVSTIVSNNFKDIVTREILGHYRKFVL